MARFLLIHGAAHGAWCWDATLPFLNIPGHAARAIDLPASGGLDDQATAIRTAIDGWPGAPVVLVGHSMAGYAITAAAESDPARIAALVYLCAFVPVPGQSIASLRRGWPERPLSGTYILSPDRASFAFDPRATTDRFYHDCPPGVAQAARARLRPEPVAPQETPFAPTGRSAGIPRAYIRCTDDRAIPPAHQTAMAATLPGAPLHDLPTGHSPFLSAPRALADLLIRIAP